jgi:hypothetical protein
VAYLGHVISVVGVAMDEQKVRIVLDWPLPKLVGPRCARLPGPGRLL